MECPHNEDKQQIVFIGKDDGEEKRVSLLVQGKHGKIGFIRPTKPTTDRERKAILESIIKVAIETTKSN